MAGREWGRPQGSILESSVGCHATPHHAYRSAGVVIESVLRKVELLPSRYQSPPHQPNKNNNNKLPSYHLTVIRYFCLLSFIIHRFDPVCVLFSCCQCWFTFTIQILSFRCFAFPLKFPRSQLIF